MRTKADPTNVAQSSVQISELRRPEILLFRPALWALLLMLASNAFGQTASPRDQPQKQNAAPASIPDPLLPAVEPAAAPLPQTPEQMPARAPQVVWDGKKLSIKSENSTLADILIAARRATKAAIEIPQGAAAERVAVDLGPGPAREVLTSLLSGGNFNYIILASDTDEDAVKSVVLTRRGKADEKMTGGVLTGSMDNSTPGVRRMPGYYNSGRGMSELSRENSSGNSSEEAAVSSEVATQEPASERAESESAGVQQTRGTETNITAPEAPAEQAGSEQAVAADRAPLVDTTASANSADAPSGTSTMPQMRDDLQRLYQQRRQMQTQVNQTVPKPTN